MEGKTGDLAAPPHGVHEGVHSFNLGSQFLPEGLSASNSNSGHGVRPPHGQ